MNRKKNLIEALRGSFMFVYNLPQLIDEEDIYDENGYVDTEFLTEILVWMSKWAELSTEIQKSLNRILGVEVPDANNQKQDNGSKWKVEDVLKHCALENNVMKLPNVQLNKKSYLEAKKWIEEAGGSWSGGKVQGFTFPFNAERVFSILHQGKRYNIQQEFQFFETPAIAADWLVSLVGGISPKDTILEPSAGRGAIIKAIHRACPDVVVDCYELMPENRELLKNLDGVNLCGDDFTKECTQSYTKIIANPPFAGNQDIKHVRLMYDHLADGGVLASITGCHWLFAQEKVCVEFREWLDSVGGVKYEMEKASFKESGTNIDTVAIVIRKYKYKHGSI